MRPVAVGDWQGDDWIIEKGLKAGDKVILDGLLKIAPGAPVRIAAPGSPNAPAGKPAAEAPPKK